MKLYSTADVTDILNKAECTVRMLAAKHGIGRKIARSWVFTDEDVELLRKIPGPGRPPQREGVSSRTN
jgi:hypothetical protein